jgi:8-oxo-dGTP pyrophosphatase MutT (NUDIX family)
MESRIVNAVGIWFFSASTHRYLYLLRNDPKHPGTWGLPGGKVEPGESLLESLQRECYEELGGMPDYQQLIPLEKFTSVDQSFVYHTFWCNVLEEFTPRLNYEHVGWAWIDAGSLPRPVHPGLWNTINLDTVQKKIATIESGYKRPTTTSTIPGSVLA